MSIARRDFLKLVGSTSLAAGLASRPASATVSNTRIPAFAFDDDSVPMNAANLCPMPVAVSEAQAAYAAQLQRSLSTSSRQSVESKKELARARIAKLLGVLADELAIVRNTSEANTTVVQGLTLADEDEIVAWDQNHPSNLLAWEIQAARSGGQVRRLSVPVTASSVDEVVANFVAAINKRTRVVTFTHISNISGFRLPAAEICAAIRERKPDIHIHIDGAQTWGAVDFRLDKVDCDSFSASAHKWFMGPREVGILFLRKQHIAKLWPNVVSVPWFGSIEQPPAGARKFDALGQRDDAAIAALVETVAVHEALTPAGIEQRSAALALRLRSALEDLAIKLVSNGNPPFASSVLILSVPRANAMQLVNQVFRDSGVQAAPTGGMRISPHIYNTDEHVDRIVAGIARNRGLLTQPG
tara:strand:+ start:10208 stop:11449 length:1242 start_codon:yes stop_codon:yes gene_type:complete